MSHISMVWMKKQECWLVLPDYHVPFHDKKIHEAICKLVKDLKPYGVVLLGDFLDMYSLSRFNQNSLGKLSNWTLSREYKEGNRVLDELDAVLPKGTKKHFLYGNHEDRYFRWIDSSDNAKVGKELIAPDRGLALDKRGYKVYQNWKEDSVTLGAHLDVIHGYFCVQHPAKKHLDAFQRSVIFGHTHKFNSIIMGKRGAFNIGFLGDKRSRGFNYQMRAERMNWVNGFAVVYIDSRGDYHVNPISCVGRTFIVNGKVYQ